MDNIKVVLLAAGLGTRLLPLTEALPKCLMPINGRPLLEYWLRMLTDIGIRHFLLNTHHHAGMVATWIKESEFSGAVQLVHEEELLGTGGTILANQEDLGGGQIMVIHTDNLCLADMQRFITAHHKRPTGCAMTMMTFCTPTPETCGIVELDNLGVVQAFHEKRVAPSGNLANAAVYIIEPEVVDFLAGLGKKWIDFSTEVIPAFIGRIFTFHNDIYHRDIGNLESLLTAQLDFPGVIQPPIIDHDSWYGLFQREKGVVKSFTSALTRAMEIEDKGIQAVPDFVSARNADVVHLAATEENMIQSWPTQKRLHDHVDSLGGAGFIFLLEARKNFSSGRLFARTGQKTMAFCRHG